MIQPRAHQLDRAAVAFIALFSAAFLFVSIVQPIDDVGRRWFSDVALSVTTLASGLLTTFFASRMTGRVRLSWTLLGLGTISWGLGMVAWSWYELLADFETPLPSLADLGYLVMIPFMFVGLVSLPAGRVPVEGRIKIALDALVVFAGVVTLAWLTLLGPLYADGESTILERTIALAYPLGDLALLAALVGGAARGWIGRRDPALAPLVLGIGTFIVADVGFAWLTQHDVYGSGSPIDLGWPVGHMLVALAAGRALTRPPTEEAIRSSSERPVWMNSLRLVAPYLSVMVATGLAAATIEPELNVQQNVVVAMAGATVLLATVRQFMTVRENDHLNRELRVFSAGLEELAAERTARLAVLHDMASGLGGASSRQASIQQLRQVAELIARQIGVDRALIFEATEPGGPLELLAANDDSATPEAATLALQSLAARAVDEGTSVSGPAEADRAGRRSGLAVPLPGAVASLGAICVSTTPGHTFAEEDQYFIESVANLVGLTLERVHAIDDLRREHAQSVQLLRAVPSVLIGTDSNEVVHLWNLAAEETFNMASAEVIGRPLASVGLPCDTGDLQRRMARAVHVGTPITDDLRFGRRDGSTGFMSLTVTRVANENGEPAGHLLVGTDITQRRELEEQLRHQALHDPLTDLANRALFRDRLEHALSRFSVDERSVGVLFIDLDDFKGVNDSMGHQVGDRVLTAAGARLHAALRPTDTLARLGGDEFAVLLEDIDEDEAAHVAATLVEELRHPFVIEGQEVRLAASIGVAVPLADSEDADDLLRNADIAMYAAKERGKGRSVVFDATLHSEVLERIEMEADLRRAVERGEFRVEYQPIVDLATGQAIGTEALVRWEHPRRGLISPIWFIPAAERSGQVSAIDLWVLRQACAQVRDWNERLEGTSTVRVAVNLSRTDLDRNEIVADVRRALDEYQVDPATIVLEITESALAEDMEAAVERLHQLKATGVRIAIDDFGTGYSSLSSLQKLPVDILKIDKSFVDALDDAADGEEVVAAIISIARVRHLQTVAEGVETWAQAQRLRRLGCELGQGYYFARPLGAEAAWRVIEDSRAPQEHTA
ncbi:MAG: EAL domain-containing protein [Dehalococcoidia bacterium]|nr:EAL domain-containing protein [Dehalococcoidia bacterium]